MMVNTTTTTTTNHNNTKLEAQRRGECEAEEEALADGVRPVFKISA